MSTFIVAFIILMLVGAGMAIGVIFGRQPIKGSCGGLGAVGVERARSRSEERRVGKECRSRWSPYH